jgi:GMP synthase-like glutamine amidotransferase
MEEPEIGWVDVELTDEAAYDPLFAGLPSRFPSFQWHYYEFSPPAGAQVLARSERCAQAFRLGDSVWAVQFHPEITRPIVDEWLAEDPDDAPTSPDEVIREFERHADAWETFGRTLGGNFLEVAERVAVGV